MVALQQPGISRPLSLFRRVSIGKCWICMASLTRTSKGVWALSTMVVSSPFEAYIGETTRQLETRLKEHRDDCRKQNLQSSAVADHAWTAHCPIKWDIQTQPRTSPLYLGAKITMTEAVCAIM